MKERRTSKLALARRLRACRSERSWSQAHLAAAAGLSLRTVQRVESGCQPAPETLQALAAVYEIEVQTLAALAPPAARSDLSSSLISPRTAALSASLLALIPFFFVLKNIGIYVLHIDAAHYLFPWGSLGESLSHPALILGAPVLAILLNLPFILGLSMTGGRGQTEIAALTFKRRPFNATIVGIALLLVIILLSYVVTENLAHLMEAVAVNAAS